MQVASIYACIILSKRNDLIKYTNHVRLVCKIPLLHHVPDSYRNLSFPPENSYLTKKTSSHNRVVDLMLKGNHQPKPQDPFYLDEFIKSKRKIIFCLHRAGYTLSHLTTMYPVLYFFCCTKIYNKQQQEKGTTKNQLFIKNTHIRQAHPSSHPHFVGNSNNLLISLPSKYVTPFLHLLLHGVCWDTLNFFFV